MSCFNDKGVPVTGGMGSFDKKFVTPILTGCKPLKIMVYSRDELRRHEIFQITAPFENRQAYE